jgi:hypothetical protein
MLPCGTPERTVSNVDSLNQDKIQRRSPPLILCAFSIFLSRSRGTVSKALAKSSQQFLPLAFSAGTGPFYPGQPHHPFAAFLFWASPTLP